MAIIPNAVKESPASIFIKSCGFKQTHQGKVRDTFIISPSQLLVHASDRISIFDHVLNAKIPGKGEILTAIPHAWATLVFPKEFKHHLIFSRYEKKYNAAYDLKIKYPILPIESCLVVENHWGKMYPYELIFRHHIGGSVYKDYQKTGIVAGECLPNGLQKWSKLDTPLFTPSTKAEEGHDVNINGATFFDEMQKNFRKGDEAIRVVKMLSNVYSYAYDYAARRGILILDTKFEVPGMQIADEFLTPDSSRFVLEEDWKLAMLEGRDPKFLDKELVRNWGRTVETDFYQDGKRIIGINNLDPKNEEHVRFVHSIPVPNDIIMETSRIYHKIFEALFGMKLKKFQRDYMGIAG